MTKHLLAVCLLTTTAGCLDMPAQQQKAEIERREATVAKLKEMGEKMHIEQKKVNGEVDSTAVPEGEKPETETPLEDTPPE